MPYRKAGTANWYITWTEQGRQRTRSSGTTDYEEAKRLEYRLRGETHSEPARVHGYTLADVLAEYLTDKPSTRAAYAVARLLETLGDGTPIADITPAEINRYKRSRNVSTGTLARELGVLRAAIRHCQRSLGWDVRTVTEGLVPAEPRGRVRWITREEADRLVESVGPRVPYLRDFILLGMHTGLRKGELLSLTWDRVDEIHRCVHFAPADHKSRTYAAVPLNDTAWSVIQRRRKTRKGPFVLHRKNGQRIGNIKKGFAAACARAGILDFRPHDLRHTSASWLVQAGVPIERVREILRHADISTTMRYAHLAPHNLAESVGLLDCRTAVTEGKSRQK